MTAFSSDPRPRIAARAVRGLLVVLLAVCAGEASAQALRTHALRAGGGAGGAGLDVLQRPAAPFYDVVALRVEFQPDTTRFTTGDGTFSDSLFRGIEVSIDPLPHDAAYFEAHLGFLSDYVERVSDGQTVVRTHLVPEVVRVSQEMAAYSPVGFDTNSDAELSKLAALVREAWTTATAESTFDLSGFDPATTAFILFHAGAGRDIELTGTTLDRTPQDLPSLSFDAAALDRLTPGEPIAFNGFPVTSTLVLPETESRLGRDFIADQDFVAEFSINGLLAASFFSYLGVPDLFNTETGESVIGPFGLMDPLGIFALRGLFPPEPSAWTKQFLGWANVLDVAPDVEPETVALTAASSLGFSDVMRVPVSGAEYFLAENRQRAAGTDELVLTIYRDGETVEQRIGLDDEGFSGFNTDAFEGGVVMAAEPYDWALPGTRDPGDGQRYDGGIVIWHVDERALRDGLAANAVNTDLDRRGVDLEEADGAQDIGTPALGLGPGPELGTPFDRWFEGNPAAVITTSGDTLSLYQNRFGPDTFPSSDANGGGPSFVVLGEFSPSAPTMTLAVRAAEGTAALAPLPALWQHLALGDPGDRAPLDDDALARLPDNGGGAVLAVQAPARPGFAGTLRLFDERTGAEIPVEGDGDVGLAVTENGLLARLRQDDAALRLDLLTRDGVQFSYAYTLPVSLAQARIVPPLMAVGVSLYALAALEDGARLLRLDLADDALALVDTGPVEDVRAIARSPREGLVVAGPTAVWVESGTGWTLDGSLDTRLGRMAIGLDATGLVAALLDRATQTVRFLLADGTERIIRPETLGLAGPLGDAPTLADLDGDGRLDVLAVFGEALVAYTQGGAVVEGFPLRSSAGRFARGARPLVVRAASDAPPAVLIPADGTLYRFTLGERVPQALALPVGRTVESAPLARGSLLAALSAEGTLRAWQTPGATAVWGGAYGSAQNTSFAEAIAEGPGGEAGGLLDAAETYNWPNPIRDGRTFLRFRTAEAAAVTITVVDLAGALVDELDAGTVVGGVPTEIAWETDAPSGVYFARVTARTEGGREAHRLIRMAIIR